MKDYTISCMAGATRSSEDLRVGQPTNDREEGRRALREIGDIRAGTTSLFSFRFKYLR
jgi:hypothetical protein